MRKGKQVGVREIFVEVDDNLREQVGANVERGQWTFFDVEEFGIVELFVLLVEFIVRVRFGIGVRVEDNELDFLVDRFIVSNCRFW